MSSPKQKQIFKNIEEARLFAKKFRELRIGKGFTQEDLALEANIDRSTIARLEAARQNITLDILFTLAKALHISPREFFPLQD